MFLKIVYLHVSAWQPLAAKGKENENERFSNRHSSRSLRLRHG
jgi:hypothetical protein